MSKNENAINNQPDLPAVVPAKPVDNVANARKFKDKWDKLKEQDGKARVHVPGTRRSVTLSHVEVAENVISVWTSSAPDAPADFVIVNGPTEVPNEHGIMIEDPLTAIALAIDGVTK